MRAQAMLPWPSLPRHVPGKNELRDKTSVRRSEDGSQFLYLLGKKGMKWFDFWKGLKQMENVHWASGGDQEGRSHGLFWPSLCRYNKEVAWLL